MSAKKLKTIVTQLKAAFRDASDSQLLGIAAGTIGVAIFPELRDSVRISPYFASDIPCSAAEQYWRPCGARATLMLNIIDSQLYELPIDWQDQVEFALDDHDLSCHWPVIKDLIHLGMGLKAVQIRSQLLGLDLAGSVDAALCEIKDTEMDL